MRKARRLLSWLLLAGGLLLLVSGSREFLSSWLAQEEISKEWKEEVERRPAPQQRSPHTLRPGEFFARLTIPRLESDFYLVEGIGKKQLRRGPGRMPGTALPGEPDKMIVAGHRDTHFRVLKDVRVGDDIVIRFDGEHFIYRVTDTKIVGPSNKEVLLPTNEPKLTLITCYPFYYVGPAPRRFIVEADLAQRVSLESSRQRVVQSPAGM